MIPKAKAAAKLKIQILAGGISHEREVSLKSGRRVADALTDAGASVVIREPDAALLANIRKDKPDVIWPVLHGASGEDGALRDILALTGVPFVGATAQSARLAWDKSIAKILVAGQGIQTPPSVTLLTAAGPYADRIDYGQTLGGGAIANSRGASACQLSSSQWRPVRLRKPSCKVWPSLCWAFSNRLGSTSGRSSANTARRVVRSMAWSDAAASDTAAIDPVNGDSVTWESVNGDSATGDLATKDLVTGDSGTSD